MAKDNGQFIIIMGVSGCGKSTIGEMLAEKVGGIYIEGDQLHPQSNIDKMSSGTALQDEDRWPWFDAIIAEAERQLEHSGIVIAGCSALKEKYRDYLFRKFPDRGRLIFLDGSFETIEARMKAREHFMPASLLKSQFDTLERPDCENAKKCLTLSIDSPIEEMVSTAEEWVF